MQGPAEFVRVEIQPDEDGAEAVALDGWIIRPPGFDASQRCPVLVHVYGEPAGQTVLDRWGGRDYLWHLMLAQEGYVVLSIDNRGTPAPRGRMQIYPNRTHSISEGENTRRHLFTRLTRYLMEHVPAVARSTVIQRGGAE